MSVASTIARTGKLVVTTKAIVGILAAEGHPRAARSEIVRVALPRLREARGRRNRQDIAKFFIQPDADRLLAAFEGPPRSSVD